MESSDVAAEVRLLSGYCRYSRHGGSDGGAGQPRARRWRQWELQGTLGGGEYEVVCWPTPLPCFYKRSMVAERFFPPYFSLFLANLAQLALLYLKNLKIVLNKLINTNKIII